MAPKCVLALLLTFALLTLQHSAAIRDKAFKPTEDHDASETVSTKSDVAPAWSFPGLPPFPPLPSLPPLPPFPALPPLPPLPPFPALPPLPPFPSLPPLPPLFPPLTPLFPPWSPGAPAPEAGTPSPPSPSMPQPTECLSSLMELMPCKDFITNDSAPEPPNPSTCCDGLKSLIDKAPVCLCHALNDDIDKVMQAPVDQGRLFMVLPTTCGLADDIVLPNCDAIPVPPLMPPPPQAAPSSEP